MADDLRAALRERLAENLWDATFKNGIHTDWALIQEGLGTKENYRRMAEALLDDWVPRAEHKRVAAGAQHVVEQMFTALERSAPAEPGYGETQYRMRVMAEAKTWLAEVRGG